MRRIAAWISVSLVLTTGVAARPADDEDPAKRAAAIEKRMTDEERITLVSGIMAVPDKPGAQLPTGAVLGAGYIPGVPRLNIPSLTETDAGLGVAWAMGGRGSEGATPLPSATAMAASWNPDLIYQGGAVIGREARAKGFNVVLAGGVNLARDPRNGRGFEYFGEDPLLSGILGGAAIAGVQSNHVISTVKHFALNDQETARFFLDARISDAHARESDLLAFQIAIERGRPGAVMCGYNLVNGAKGCGNDYLLNQVLKRDWRYNGFVMSDWGSVDGVDFALKGLDQQSGSQLDKQLFFGAPLKDAASRDPAYRARLSDMARRVLYAIYANGLDRHPVKPGGAIDKEAGLATAEAVAKEGIVLLKNEGNILPLVASARRIAVIGGYADTGVLSGGGSTQVHMDGGPAASLLRGGTDDNARFFFSEQYHRSTPPLTAIRKRAPDAAVPFRNGTYVADAVAIAKNADIAIVFANQWQGEAMDVPDLSLPRGQDALIAAVAAANPRTIVVLQTGGPVAMPWLDKVAGVIEAWYPGGRGGEAIASVLFGDTNPSGRLAVTFPMSIDDLPRPVIDGYDAVEPEVFTRQPPARPVTVNYDIEGSDVGYRWHARTGRKPLFPFGYGLSYTSFETSGLKMTGLSATLTVRNTGSREGATVAQLYLVGRPDGRRQRLAGFQKVWLKPGESRTVKITVDPRIVADYRDSGWVLAGGRYDFALGEDADRLGPAASVMLGRKSWGP